MSSTMVLALLSLYSSRPNVLGGNLWYLHLSHVSLECTIIGVRLLRIKGGINLYLL
jgi:hypothetical protein